MGPERKKFLFEELDFIGNGGTDQMWEEDFSRILAREDHELNLDSRPETCEIDLPKSSSDVK